MDRARARSGGYLSGWAVFAPNFDQFFLLPTLIARVLDLYFPLIISRVRPVPGIISGPSTHSMVPRDALGRS